MGRSLWLLTQWSKRPTMNWLVFCSRDSVPALEPRALSSIVMSVKHNNDYALQFSVEIKNELSNMHFVMHNKKFIFTLVLEIQCLTCRNFRCQNKLHSCHGITNCSHSYGFFHVFECNKILWQGFMETAEMKSIIMCYPVVSNDAYVK